MNLHQSRFLLVVFLSAYILTVHAGSYEEGLEAYKIGDHNSAFEIWFELAKKHDARAQAAIGQLILDNTSDPQEAAKSVVWYTLAAQKGLLDAQYNLGVLYEQGRGVKQNFAEAAKWYYKASLNYTNYSVDFPPSPQALTNSYFNLGNLYERGLGVKQSYIQAHKYFNIAVGFGGGSRVIQRREDVAKKMTQDELAIARAITKEFIDVVNATRN